jgi:hypothetical protein
MFIAIAYIPMDWYANYDHEQHQTQNTKNFESLMLVETI